LSQKFEIGKIGAVNFRGLFKALAIALIGLVIFIVVLWLWVGENAS
jgi:hypothetical protein